MFGMTAASLAVRFLAGHQPVTLVPALKSLPADEPVRDPRLGPLAD